MATGETHRCPCCDRTLEGEADLRFHLMANHRKSELTGVLVDGLSARPREDETLAPR